MNTSKNVLILGANGFIGSSLCWAILNRTNWNLTAFDMADGKIQHCLGRDRFTFKKGDVTKDTDWIEEQIKKCDVVLPLVAIATPALYVKDPIRVYNLDYESNVAVIKICVKHKKRIIFPSTSEVYGMCQDPSFDEYSSNLTLGPIPKERWIYSCIKQLLDRLIWAYGAHEGLDFTLVRPFNFIGPKLDDVKNPKEGASRVLTQFIHNIINGKSIKLVDGGKARRSFTFIDDAMDCLLKIIENKNGCASRQIFNIGNPYMDFSIKQLAEMLIELVATYPDYEQAAKNVKIEDVSSREYYGEGYQDVAYRIPSIKHAEELLGWKPKTDLKTALKLTLDYHLAGKDYELESVRA